MGLAGCATAPQSTPTQAAATEQQPAITEVFRDARQALESGEFGNARLHLQQLDPQQLPVNQRIEWLLLATEIAQGSQQSDEAALLLQQLDGYLEQVTPSQDARISYLKARQYEADGEYFAAARERVFVASQLPANLGQQNHEAIWQDLSQMPYEEITNRLQQNAGTELGQWLQLAELARRPDLGLDDQLRALQQWQQRYPLHPAARQLPGNLAHLSEIAAQRPQRVAVALPLSGPLAASGEAIRDGLLASYYSAQAKQQPTPDLTFIDTLSADSIDAVYAEALMAGAQWLIGPVNKQQVQHLQGLPTLSLPTLALNYADLTPATELPVDAIEPAQQQTIASNLYQFGLAPEDEAIQAADRAWADGYRRALVMVPEGDWGERIFESFRDYWLQLGGKISETRFYKNQNDYNPDIKALLNVDESNQRFKQMRQLLRQTTEFEPRRREDADWLFLVAQPQQARQIKPTLAFNFAGNLPVYATSHVYSGYPEADHDRDLNGIQFCDLPWVLEKGELYQQVEKSLPRGQGPYLRLYALGVDAYRLLPRLPQLQAFPDSQIGGVTGQLTLDPQRRVRRQTECAVFRAGEPQLIGSAD